MKINLILLLAEAMAVYFLVLWSHSLRKWFGLSHFYALLGGITAVMSWVTDAGLSVEIYGITFMIGSTVFYTSLLLGVFAIYIFDGVRATRIAISTIAAVSILVPLIASLLHFQMNLSGTQHLNSIPVPSLRINGSSVVTTVIDMLFLAIAWEYLGRPELRIRLWLRAFITLLGVMWLDVILFTSGAFLGNTYYLKIMEGTLISRFLLSVFAFPFLYLYLNWQNRKWGALIENRPVLSIIKEVTEIRMELHSAQEEIVRRKQAEKKNEELIQQLKQALSEVKTLRGFLPICASCKKIRDDHGYWQQVEIYLSNRTDAQFSHGICPDCLTKLYPDYKKGKG